MIAQPNNDRHHRVAGVDFDFKKTLATATPVHGLGTPGMGVILWGASPLYATGSLKEVSIPNDRSD